VATPNLRRIDRHGCLLVPPDVSIPEEVMKDEDTIAHVL
jgi:hypothetical protein